MAKKRKRQIRNKNSELPWSIMEVIFSKLPFYILPSCRIVCKEWNELISTCKFGCRISNFSLFFDRKRGNLVRVEFDPNPRTSTVASFNFHPKLFSGGRIFIVLNHCNGLLCFLMKKFSRNVFTSRALCVVNPMTNEYLKLPISKADWTIEYQYGFGFSPKTKQYKIARASIKKELCGTLIEIFAFGTSREWVTVGFVPGILNSEDFVYFNGGIYLHKDERYIYRLDVEDETIRVIPSPIDKGVFWQIVGLNGTLYQVSCSHYYIFYVWKMMEDFSWIKVFVFYGYSTKPSHFKLLEAYEDGKILCEYNRELILYDPMSETIELSAEQDGEVKRLESFHIFPNFNSLLKILAGNA